MKKPRRICKREIVSTRTRWRDRAIRCANVVQFEPFESLEPRQLLSAVDFLPVDQLGVPLVSPAAALAADFNNDGILDIATVSNPGFGDFTTPGVASVFLNLTEVGATELALSPREDFTIRQGAGPMRIADINLDGKLDIVVLVAPFQDSEGLSFLINTTADGASTPTFLPVQHVIENQSAQGNFELGDINGDGLLDAVITEFGGNRINVLMNQTTPGSSTVVFSSSFDFSIGNSPAEVAIDDLNADGRPDVVVTDAFSIFAYMNHTPNGSPAPVFIQPSHIQGSSRFITLELSDINQDGRPDIVATGDDVVVFLNETSPGAADFFFSTPFATPISGTGGATAIGDFDADGVDDIAFTLGSDIGIIINQTAVDATLPTLLAPQFFNEGTGGRISGANLNGGRDDLLINSASIASHVSVLLSSDPEPPSDFGDAPASYGTLLANNGARHGVAETNPLRFNFNVDVDADGQPSARADGDATDGEDDENGIFSSFAYVAGTSELIPFDLNGVPAGGAFVNAWIDFDQNGAFDPNEQVITDLAGVEGFQDTNIDIPIDAMSGTTYARFRVSTQAGLGPTGAAPDGEVEDYLVGLNTDFGDAPAPFPVSEADDAARHLIAASNPLRLGAEVTADIEGINRANANNDQDDGITVNGDALDQAFFHIGKSTMVDFDVRGNAGNGGLLTGWIDWNQDGDWLDDGEQLFADEVLLDGVNTLVIDPPDDALQGETSARFRLSTESGLSILGLASDGEVEDYKVHLIADDTPPVVALTVSSSLAGTPPTASVSILDTAFTDVIASIDRMVSDDGADGVFDTVLINTSLQTVHIEDVEERRTVLEFDLSAIDGNAPVLSSYLFTHVPGFSTPSGFTELSMDLFAYAGDLAATIDDATQTASQAGVLVVPTDVPFVGGGANSAHLDAALVESLLDASDALGIVTRRDIATGSISIRSVNGSLINGFPPAIRLETAILGQIDPNIEDNTQILIDVDLNNDGDFDDVNEMGFAVGNLISGEVDVELDSLTAPGDYMIRARATDQAGNEGVSDEMQVTVLDDGPPAVSIADVSQNEGDQGLTAFEFTVSLSTASNDVVTVDFTTANDTATSLRTTRVANGLNSPVYVTAPPADLNRLFIVEKGGTIRILDRNTGNVLATPFVTVPNVFNSGERGLLGLAFHPNFANNGLFYTSYSRSGGAFNQGVSHITQWSVDGDPLTDNTADPNSQVEVLSFDQPFSNHNGGWIGFGPDDGMLYISSGDGGSGNDPVNAGQSLDTLLGKMLRIDVNGDEFPADADRNYAIPNNNPFANDGDAGTFDEIWAWGLRNPWRPSFDRGDQNTGDGRGNLYIADVGQNRREEVNVQLANSPGGENYGWRLREGTIATQTGGVGGPKPAGAIDPIHDYQRNGTTGNPLFEGNSVTGGYVYRGPISGLSGHYFFGDFISSNIWSLKFDGSDPTTHDGTNFTDHVNRNNDLTPNVGSSNSIVSFGEDAAGNVYIIDFGGEVFMIDPLSDYQPTSGTLTFAPGETQKTITVDVFADLHVEGDETFMVNLSNVTGTGVTIDDGTAVGTILNDDVADLTPPVAPGDAVINGGSAQRSAVRALAFAFDEPVSVTGNAITITNLDTGQPVDVNAFLPDYDAPNRTAIWSFPLLVGDTLVDGNYRVTLAGDFVTDAAGNVLGGDHAFDFHRFYGDVDGDRLVGTDDLFQFRQAFGTVAGDSLYNPALDDDFNGNVNNVDLFQFRQRFLSTLLPPTAPLQQSSASTLQSFNATGLPETVGATDTVSGDLMLQLAAWQPLVLQQLRGFVALPDRAAVRFGDDVGDDPVFDLVDSPESIEVLLNQRA